MSELDRPSIEEPDIGAPDIGEPERQTGNNLLFRTEALHHLSGNLALSTAVRRWGAGILRVLFGGSLLLPLAAAADVYSYVNPDGDYVVSQQRPKNVSEYAVLSDTGEFRRLVRVPNTDVPITHWRPWYLPREPHPFDGPAARDFDEAEPHFDIEEVEGDR